MRRLTNTMAISASANGRLTGSRRLPSTGTANGSAGKGCSSCTWLTPTMSPMARPPYRANKPSRMENRLT
jgi:hypothetical protein